MIGMDGEPWSGTSPPHASRAGDHRVTISRVRVERIQSRARELLDDLDGTTKPRRKSHPDAVAEAVRGIVHDLMEIADEGA